jgi:steroid 5-alpha reductase family enzyme
MVPSLIAALLVLLTLMTFLWVASIALRNVAIVDLFWGAAVAIPGCVYWLNLDSPSSRATLVVVLALVWAARLCIYLVARNSGKPEDRRYRDMRERNNPGFQYKSVYIVFWLQGFLAWVIGLPLYGATSGQVPLGVFDLLGVTVFCFGLIWESIADWQLAHFLKTRENKKAVLDSGLWRYTRHPNYFGEFCLWWGLWMLAAAAGAAWTIIGPLLLSFFLLKVSGVALLEKDISERRPAYQEYIDRTSAFFPRAPKSSG